MNLSARNTILSTVFILAVFCTPLVKPQDVAGGSHSSQQLSSSDAATKDRLLAAHNIAIIDGSSDSRFPVSVPYGRNRFRSGVKSWGRYQIVSDPKNADLVFQINIAENNSGTHCDATDSGKKDSQPPCVIFTIVDPATRNPLWSVAVATDPAVQVEEVSLFAFPMQNIVTTLKLLVGDPVSRLELLDLAIASHPPHVIPVGVGKILLY